MKDILDIAFQRGVRVEFADLGSRNGEYADGVVTINHRRPEHVQRIILAHELGHHAHDHKPTENRHRKAFQEREADRHAARLLVDRITYQNAEQMYGPSVGAVAAELGVPARYVEALRDVTLRGEWPPLCSMTHDERRLA